MQRICEIIGLSLNDVAEITAFYMGIVTVCVFVGNIIFWAFEECIEILEHLIDRLVGLIREHIVKKHR